MIVPATASSAQQQAFANFNNSAGMQVQRDAAATGMDHYAARHLVGSPAVMEALRGYSDNQATARYFTPYTNMLSAQQGLGANTGRSVAQVGQNYGRTANGIYSGMMGAHQAAGNAAANAAMAKGAANTQMWGTIGSAIGGFAGSLF